MTDETTPTSGATPLLQWLRTPTGLSVIGLGVAAVLFLSAAIPVLGGGDDDQPTLTTPTAPVRAELGSGEGAPTTITASGGPTTPPPATTVPPADADLANDADDDDADATAAPSTVPATTIAVTTTIAPTTLPPEPPEESTAVLAGGKIYLSGDVPSQEAIDLIVGLASAILGPENVINEYSVDPRASDPSEGNIRLDDNVLFESDSAVIAREFEPVLGQALALMQLRPSVTMTVVGHTDDRGDDAYNLRLSQWRAEAVTAWLEQRGIDPARLTAEGRGESEPIASNDTSEGRQLNRRIQVFLENLLADG